VARRFSRLFPDDPNLALLKVDIESGAYWDEPSNLCVRAFAYAKVITTGKKHQPTPDEQAKVQA
jgi:hypothetical protein